MKRILILVFYYCFAYYLPDSYSMFLGKLSNKIRIFCVKNIFKSCGNIRTINRRVFFGGGSKIVIGDESGIGARVNLPNDIQIGNNVTIGRDVFFLNRNPNYDRVDIPINHQGKKEAKKIIIEDDCWIGMRSTISPNRTVKKGSIVAMGTVLVKDFDSYSIIGGNPSKLIKNRKV